MQTIYKQQVWLRVKILHFHNKTGSMQKFSSFRLGSTGILNALGRAKKKQTYIN